MPIVQVSGAYVDLDKCGSVLLAGTVPRPSMIRVKTKEMLGPVAPGTLTSRHRSLKPLSHIPDFISCIVQFACAGSSVLTEPVKN